MRGWFLLFAVLCLARPAMAEADPPFGVAVFDFGGVSLGQAPDDDMICTRGPCFAVEGDAVPKSRQFIFSIYKKPLEITHYGKVEIAAPQYYFFENQLFQILFRVLCAPDEADACLERIAAQFQRDYPLTMNKGQDSGGATVREFRTESGAVIKILSHASIDGEPSSPSVKIFDKTLMDAVRLSLNPNYVPAEYR